MCRELARLRGRAGPHWEVLLEAGQCLVQMVDIWSTCGPNVPDESVEKCFQLYNRYMELMHQFDMYVPKHHLVYHLIANLPWHGAPSAYATWLDESLNKALKACCRNVSQLCFEQTVLCRMEEVLARGEY